MNELAAIRARLDSLLSPALVSERRRDCPNPDCWHDLDPCLDCRESFEERLKLAEQSQREFKRHAVEDVGLLLPVVEALVAGGYEAALSALAQELERRQRGGLFMPVASASPTNCPASLRPR